MESMIERILKNLKISINKTNMKKIIITGGAGFIGTHMSNFLIKKNYKVKIIDNLIYGNKKNINKKAIFKRGNIGNKKFLVKEFKGYDAVIHLAAMSRSGPSDKEIDTCLNQNTIGTKNVLEASRINKIKKLIYAGSATFYGNQKGNLKEKTKGDFFNPYSLSKYFGEELCLFYNKKKYVNCNVMRYFNVYGKGQPSKGIYALVIGIFLSQKKLRKPLIIYGDGKQSRDFVHVNDEVNANYKALLSNLTGEVFNVGFGKNYTINFVASLISSNIKHTKKREGEARETLANIANIKKKLNWEPKIDIKTGLSLTI